MSFTIVEQAPARLNRSELAVPGSNPKLFEKAAGSDADVVFLDLEDAVAPDEKEQARKNVIEAINDIDWGSKTLSLRINGLDTHYMYRDVVDVIEQTGDRLDLIMIPKVGTAADVYAVDMLVTQCEDAKGRTKRIGFEHIIETALGMANVDEIAAASKRNESLHFGVADYAASTKARTTVIGGPNPLYGVLTDKSEASDRATITGATCGTMPSRAWWWPPAPMACRPIDGPFGDFKDPDGFRAQANRAAVLGCEGKWAIHPSQIALANEVNSPSEAEVTKAKRILEAMEKAKKEGLGAVQLDGRLIDIASIKQAEVMVQKAAQVAVAPRRYRRGPDPSRNRRGNLRIDCGSGEESDLRRPRCRCGQARPKVARPSFRDGRCRP